MSHVLSDVKKKLDENRIHQIYLSAVKRFISEFIFIRLRRQRTKQYNRKKVSMKK